jgi:hypothetical protein
MMYTKYRRVIAHEEAKPLQMCNNETIFCIYHRAVNHVTGLSRDFSHPLVRWNGLYTYFHFCMPFKKIPLHSVFDASARWIQQLEKFNKRHAQQICFIHVIFSDCKRGCIKYINNIFHHYILIVYSNLLSFSFLFCTYRLCQLVSIEAFLPLFVYT